MEKKQKSCYLLAICPIVACLAGIIALVAIRSCAGSLQSIPDITEIAVTVMPSLGPSNSPMPTIVVTPPPAAEITAPFDPTVIPTTSPTPESTASFDPTVTPTTSSTPVPVSEEGPWIIYADIISATELWRPVIVNHDGSGHTTLDVPVVPWMRSYEQPHFASPSGGHIALQVLEGDADYQLWVLDLPGLNILRKIPLMSEEVQRTIVEQESGSLYAYARSMRLVAQDPTLFRWSPNGRYLAFTAALDELGMNVYVYDLVQDSVTRLTTGHSLALIKSWSPNSQWVVYGDTTDWYTDAGIGKGIWAASVAGDSVRELYAIDHHPNQEIILGWNSENTFVSEMWLFEGPTQRLQEVNVETGHIRTLYDDDYSGAALDPETGTIVFRVTEDPLFGGTPQLEDGLYYLSAHKNEPEQIFAGSYELVMWFPELGKFAACQGWSCITFHPKDESYQTYEQVDRLHPSPDGQWLLAESGGKLDLYDSDGRLIQRVGGFSFYERSVLWLPDSTAFYVSVREEGYTKSGKFLNAGILLFFCQDDGWEPQVVDESINYYPGLALVNPLEEPTVSLP